MLFKKTGTTRKKTGPTTFNLKFFRKNKNSYKIYRINLERFLKRFLKEEYDGKINLSDYKIRLSYGRGSCRFSEVYRDAPYCFILTKRVKEPTGKKEEALACTSLELDKDLKIVVIKQIQGVGGKQKELQPFRWEKMLLTIMTEWARANRFRRIDVIRADDSEWFAKHDKARCKRMYLKYDVTARRLGFKFNPDCNRYTKMLK